MSDSEHASLRDGLRKLYQSDKNAQSLFNWLNSRTNGARETKVRVAADRTECEYQDIYGVFKYLDTLNAGRVIVGRKGAETRFAWSYDVKSLAEMASGEADKVAAVAENAPNFDDEILDVDMKDYRFPLRHDLELTISLPADFTEAEAKRLSVYISAMAIG